MKPQNLSPPVCRSGGGYLFRVDPAPKRFGPEDHERRRRNDDPERGFRQIAPRRQPRELAHNELQIAFDHCEVGARLIGLSQRQAVFILA